MRPRVVLEADQLASISAQHPDHVDALTRPTALDVSALAVMCA